MQQSIKKRMDHTKDTDWLDLVPVILSSKRGAAEVIIT